jgi:hypothetical protein
MDELPVIACTLRPDELPDRRRRWVALLEKSLQERVATPAGARLALAPGPEIEDELRELAALERDCCGFASFTVAASPERVTLEIASSGDGVEAVRRLFL